MDFQDDDLVPAEIACEIIGGRHSPINRATLYRLIRMGRLPKPLKPSPGISRWRVRALREFIAGTEQRAI